MDDFGTGYSSLSNLRAFPFDKIKIDGSFIRSADSNDEAATIVRAVLGLGRGLGLPVLAEGVETEGELAFLAAEACTEAQGYFLGRPGPIEDYRDLVMASSDSIAVAGADALPGLKRGEEAMPFPRRDTSDRRAAARRVERGRRHALPALAFPGKALYVPPQSAGPSWGLNGGPDADLASAAKPEGLPPPVSPLSTVSTCAFLPRPSSEGRVRRSRRGLAAGNRERNEERQVSNGSIRTCISCPPGSDAAAGRRPRRAVQGCHREQWRHRSAGSRTGD